MRFLPGTVGLTLLACASPTAHRTVVLDGAPVEIEIAFGETVAIQATPVLVRFVEVEQDSRCAADVVCVWQGTAGIELLLTDGSSPGETVVLHTGREPATVEFAGLALRLEEVTPYPERHDERIPLERYRARLLIESVGDDDAP